MSFYIAFVGEVIIKPEHRAGFGRLFHNDYAYDYEYEIDDEVISDFARAYENVLSDFSNWHYSDCKPEWENKYRTTYDETTGLFVYGIEYNMHSHLKIAMRDFFNEFLPTITERVISEDFWSEE